MFKKIIPMAAVLSLSILCADGPAAISKKDKRAKVSAPFLIMEKMPHLTKKIKQNWDDRKLGLSDKQKTELVKVREETISAVTRLKKEINELENTVANKAMSGANPGELKDTVNKIALLKAEATMVHLNCIYNTKNILSKEQFKYINEH